MYSSSYKKLKRRIDQTLRGVLPGPGVKPGDLHRAMIYAVFPGGKRIRPVLVCEAALLCGDKVRQVLPVAAAIEMIHCYSLVHDDLPAMDGDDLRRGRPTVHKKFGEATALLAGCGLLTRAFEILSKYPVVAGRVAEAVGSQGMIGGQALDLAKDKNLKLVNHKKTGELFRVSLEAGAVVAGCSGKKLAAVSRFGVKLGELFQLTDDLLDSDGFVKRVGRRKTIERAGQAARQAKQALSIFTRRARRLEEITERILTRAS